MSPPLAMSPNGAALSLENLHVRFGMRAGLTNVSIRVARGERLAIVGPSGVGKTTLLRAIAGLAPLASGRIVVDGRDVTSLRPERRNVVYLHQSPVLFEHLSVGENVAFSLRIRSAPAEEVRVQVAAALSAMQLSGFERRAPHTLSGGQRHRVALARAIVARPAVLLLDEPLSALDPALRDDVRAAIVAAQTESGSAVVFVTHDFDDAGAIADSIAVLLDGTIVQCASPADVFASPATLAVARLLGVYQTIDGRVSHAGGVQCVFGTLPIPTPLSGGTRVVLAFRSNGLRLLPITDESSGAIARVIDMRHRARGTSAMVMLENAAPDTAMEVVVEPNVVDALCGNVRLCLDPRAVRVFPV